MNTKGNNAQQITPVAADVINSLRSGCGNPLVAIHCTAYNQEGYIRDALEGFVSQRTEFPFVAIVHDDASTDDTQKIIREYSDKYPDIIVPIIETQNLYSRKDGSITRIMNEAIAATGARYVAYCEGDDYWTDPYKLSKQVAFLEAHPDYSMCFTNAAVVDGRDGSTIRYYDCYPFNCDVSIDDLILRGGDLCATNSIVMRTDALWKMPYEARHLYVGDYPLQIFMGHVGKVYYLNEITAAYRYLAVGSWTIRVQNISLEDRIRVTWPKHFKLLEVMDNVTDRQYSKNFEIAKMDFIFWEYRRFGYYVSALKTWPKLYQPYKRYGMMVFFDILGKGWLKRKVKRFLRR